jgi:hypothetical protein
VFFVILAVSLIANQGCTAERKQHGCPEERHTGVEVARPGSYDYYHYDANFIIDGSAYLDGQVFTVTEPSKNVNVDASVDGNSVVAKIEWFRPSANGQMEKFATGNSYCFKNPLIGKSVGRWQTYCYRVDITWVDINVDAVRGKLVPANEDPRYHKKSILLCLQFTPTR